MTPRRLYIDSIAVAVAVMPSGLAFGATAVTSGFSAAQACFLSLAMFTGASQFALVGVLGGGGSVGAALSVAWGLGARNGLYAARLSSTLPASPWRRASAAQLVLDESMAMSVTRDDPAVARAAFWATGLSLFVLWNVGTLIGALAGTFIEDPRTLGLDTAFPAAFLALVWPQVRGRPAIATAATSALVACATVPLLPRGLPVLVCAFAVISGIGVSGRRSFTERST